MDPISASLHTSENAGKAPSGCSTDMRSANPFGAEPTTASRLACSCWAEDGGGGHDFPRFRSYLLEPDLCFLMYTECIDISLACVTNLSKLIAWRRRQCESLSTALPKIVLAPTRIYDFHLHIAKQEMGHGSFPTTPHHCILLYEREPVSSQYGVSNTFY